MGGRTWSATFPSQPPQYLAELGAMRFPPSEYSLFHYLDQFDFEATSSFPDPGSVLTTLGYQGQTYVWEAGAKHLRCSRR
ncbi:FAD-dependent oxidoreductase [Burkholderia sp. PAMC 26561]|uniref:FAD-dependent oxidoreductase n=1 Tax=Burkholderia sp. PAMC 26561 TaxID=1795043 RepID=UPI00202B421F|nr:FAD-dependent oxidoreductase [Burkholderia sp. PAMC 26561]